MWLPEVFPARTQPLGFSYEEWTVRWWKWILGIPKERNPAFDRSGEDANIEQKHSGVVFLCQTIEGDKHWPTRKISIPTGSHVFIPIINWISIFHKDGESEMELSRIAKIRMDVVSDLRLRIGKRVIENLREYRYRSPFFNFRAPENNIFDISPGTGTAMSDGYWVFLGPIEHSTRLSTFGSCTSGATKIGIDYVIDTM